MGLIREIIGKLDLNSFYIRNFHLCVLNMSGGIGINVFGNCRKLSVWVGLVNRSCETPIVVGESPGLG